MKCRYCNSWDPEDGNGAGMCENIFSPNFNFWTYPDDGCSDDDSDGEESDD